MILSRKYKFIFLKTAKTAGTSFEIALSRHLGEHDIITPISPDDEALRSSLGFRGPQNHSSRWQELIRRITKSSAKPTYYNHMTAERLRDLVGNDVFSSYQKASIVRNPFDMAVSLYFWQFRQQSDLTQDHFRKWLLSKPSSLFKNLSITQISGECVVDFMIRFEAFEEDIQAFSERVGLPPTLHKEFASIRAKSQHRPRYASTHAMFEGFDKGKALIEDLFRDDIQTYGYALPPSK